jgi:hypothetical protein
MACTVLIIIITAMILVSLHPFVFRKVVLLAAILGLSSILCFGDSILLARRYAPAERRPGSGASKWSPGDIIPSGASSVPGDGNREACQAEKKFFDVENIVATPIGNQAGHVPACVRHIGGAILVGTSSA